MYRKYKQSFLPLLDVYGRDMQFLKRYERNESVIGFQGGVTCYCRNTLCPIPNILGTG